MHLEEELGDDRMCQLPREVESQCVEEGRGQVELGWWGQARGGVPTEEESEEGGQHVDVRRRDLIRARQGMHMRSAMHVGVHVCMSCVHVDVHVCMWMRMCACAQCACVHVVR